MALQQQVGTDTAKIIQHLQKGTTPTPAEMETGSWEYKKLARMTTLLRLHNSILQVYLAVNKRRYWSQVCPITIRESVIWETHRQHHAGINKTLQRVKQSWYWPGMTGSIRRVVRSCEICQAAKHSTTRLTRNRQRLHAGRPWQVVSVDLVGPFQITPRGNTTVLVLTDHFTRWKDALPLPNGTAETVARALDEKVFCYFGVPERIHTDQGAQFESRLMKEMCHCWGVQKSHTTPYRPQANGVVERGNKDLGNALRALLLKTDESEWDLLLPQLLRSMRGTTHRATDETPNYMMLGRELRLPDQLIYGAPTEEVTTREEYVVNLQNRLQEAHQLLRERQDTLRSTDHQESPLYSTGEQVWLRSKRHRKGKTSKLQAKFLGPFTILEVADNHTYVIEQHGRQSRETESRLKLYHPTTHPSGRAPTTTEPSRQPTRHCYRQQRKGEQLQKTQSTGIPGNPTTTEGRLLRQASNLADNRQQTIQGEVPRSTQDDITTCNPTPTQAEADPAAGETATAGENMIGRQPRIRRHPGHLRDFVATVTMAVDNKAAQEEAASTGMAQQQIELHAESEYDDDKEDGELDNLPVLQIELGESSRDSTSAPQSKRAREPDEDDSVRVTGDSKDTLFLSNYTLRELSRLIEDSTPNRQCDWCGKSYEKYTDISLRIHLEEHLIHYVCACAHHSNSRDVITRHQRTRPHPKGRGSTLFQVDRTNWYRIKQRVPGIGECPDDLPYSDRPVPHFKERKRKKPMTTHRARMTPTSYLRKPTVNTVVVKPPSPNKRDNPTDKRDNPTDIIPTDLTTTYRRGQLQAIIRAKALRAQTLRDCAYSVELEADLYRRQLEELELQEATD